MFKAKRLIERGVPATSNRCPDHLSRQFLTTASTFPYRSKNSSAEHIHALSTCLTLTNTLTHIDKQTNKHTHTHTHTHTLSLSLIPQPNIFLLYQHGSPSQTHSHRLTHSLTNTHMHKRTHSLTHSH